MDDVIRYERPETCVRREQLEALSPVREMDEYKELRKLSASHSYTHLAVDSAADCRPESCMYDGRRST